jgi:hypothetical protein
MEDNTEFEIQPQPERDEPAESGQEQSEKSTSPPQEPAAFTLVIQSWATPLVGIIMLAVGFLGGYFLRPSFSPNASPTAIEGAASEMEDLQIPTSTADPERAAQQQELMNALVERTRHFRGDPDAPVTIIEFSDFQ